MKAWIPLVLVVGSVLASCQTTQQPLRPGLTRTAIAGSYSDLDSPVGDTKETELELAWGTFLESNQELGVKGSYVDRELNGGSTDAWTAAIYGRYYFSTADVLLPWFELDLGWTDDRSDSNVSYGAGLGITQFISQGGAVEASFDYSDAFGDVENSGFRFLIGYAIFF